MRLEHLKKWKRSLEDYTIIETVGKGVFGAVAKAQDRYGNTVALKTISKHSLKWKREFAEVMTCASLIQMEYKAGKRLKHPGVVRIRRCFETEDSYVIVMDFLEGIDLIDFMLQREEVLDEESAKGIFRQLVSILQYCHSQGVAHRDVKLDNIRISTTGVITLYDFGLCTFKNADRCVGCVGSSEYTAPEVNNRIEYSAYKADVWSAGVVLYTLLCKSFPFTARERTALSCGDNISLHFPESVSLEARELISAMLSTSPRHRPSFDQISSFSWLATCL